MRGRMKKSEKIWSIIKSYVIMIVACILLLFIKEHILALLDKVVSWLHLCSKEWFAVIITTAGIVFSILIIYEIHKKKRQVANSTLATVLFIIVVYSFFRFIDNTYLFWGLDYYKWCDIIYFPFILLILQKIICRRPPKDLNNTCIHIVDKPIERAEDDRFYYDWMSKGLLSDLETVDVKERSYSVGVLGIWGQGKSSFLNLFKRHAIENQDIVVEFYPRASKSINNIQEDYFIALKESLKKYHTGIGRYISNYARAVAEVDEGWIGKIVLALSIYSKEKEKSRVNSIIKSIGKRIFVIIEDLDRLTGEEIIEVLKLLERNGDFCNTVYLTAYDKKYINEVIGKYLQYSRSQDYTDKYFDYEYSLPKNSEQVLYSFAIQYLTDKVIFQQEDKNYKQDLLNSWESIGQLVVNNLETMRHVKRYLNIFMSRYPKVKNDVDLTDFLLLTLLRYKDLAAYNAIFELRFIRRGSISEGKQKMLYLRTDYEAILKELNIHSYSKKIIELLFHKSEDMHGTTLKDVYSKLEWVESFNSYFFDYRVGKYHYEDYLELFKADEPVAFSTIETMQKDGISIQLTDFLKSRRENWVIDEAGLSRLFKIFIYLNSIARTLDLDFLIDGFMTTETMNEYLKARVVKDKKSYIDTIDKAITEMSSVCPIEVNYSCQRNIEDIYDGQTNNSFIYTQDKLIEWAVAAQKCYYHRFPNDGYDINVLLNLAKVKELKNNQLVFSDSSKKELVSLMKSYPEQFAKEIVAINSFVVANTKRVIGVSFIKGFEYEVLLNVDGFSFEDWIHTINDKKMSYVLQRIYAQRNNNGLQVPALKEKYENGDFAGLYEAIRANENEDDDKKVLFIINRHLSLDYGTIQELTGIEINRVKASITRLVNEKKIDKKYATMKERMEPFEKGDYVKLIDESYNTYAKNLYYSSNIFEIDGIQKDGTYKLSDIEISVPRKDIEAIPIDGKHDRNIYYNPPVISIDHSTPLPHVDEDEYYLNSLKTDIMSEGKTLKNIVEENDCQYLHEVQHCLRRLNNNVDNLYLNKTI
jgi:hypothetical protein